MTPLLRRGVLAAALLVTAPALGLAHEPGLSALDLRVTRIEIVVDLSLAEADARAAGELRVLALEAIEVRVDESRLQGTVSDVAVESGSGVRVRVTYERPPGARMAIRSAVPLRLGRSHRELLSIRDEHDALLAERMLDGGANEEIVDLRTSSAARGDIAIPFFVLGVQHIFGGLDHLLFIVGVVVAVPGRREAIKSLTAFTVAHSITLGAAVTGVIQLPPEIVEPLIAASILYVGAENLLTRKVRARSALTFGLGLIHGFGFAAALDDLGIGTRGSGIALPLASFNLGVEAGQIAVAAALLSVARWFAAPPIRRARFARACSATLVAAGGYWLVERTVHALSA